MNLRETIRKVIKEQQDIKDVEFLYKIIKRIIPDNSVFTSRYDMPYADTGEVEVYIEYSVTPKTEINKSSEGYYTVNLHLDIEKLMWKGPYDDDFENVPGLYDIPEYIFQELGYEHRKRLEKLVGELYFDQDYDYKERRD
jgi:hypothetical protein